MQEDWLYKSAETFLKLCDYNYQLELLDESNNISIVLLDFEKTDYKHLSGIEKLKIESINNIKPTDFLDAVLERKVNYNIIQKSQRFNEYIDGQKNGKFKLVDRLAALASFYDDLRNATSETLHIYQWKKNVHKNNRPHKSNINGDYLVELKPKRKTDNVVAFFIKSKPDEQNEDNRIPTSPTSLFPTDKNYYKDNTITEKLYQILKIVEINKKENKSEVLFELSKDKINEIKLNKKSSEISKAIKADIKQLKSARNKYFSEKTEQSKIKYEKSKNIFKNKNIYTQDKLNGVLKSLESQLNDPHLKEYKYLISEEIKFIEQCLNQSVQEEISDNSVSIPNTENSIMKQIGTDNKLFNDYLKFQGRRYESTVSAETFINDNGKNIDGSWIVNSKNISSIKYLFGVSENQSLISGLIRQVSLQQIVNCMKEMKVPKDKANDVLTEYLKAAEVMLNARLSAGSDSSFSDVVADGSFLKDKTIEQRKMFFDSVKESSSIMLNKIDMAIQNINENSHHL